MSLRERQNQPARRAQASGEAEQEAREAIPRAGHSRTTGGGQAQTAGQSPFSGVARLWVLPTAQGGWWAVPIDGPGLAAALRSGPPQLVGVEASPEEQARMVSAARPAVMKVLGRRVGRFFFASLGLALPGCGLAAWGLLDAVQRGAGWLLICGGVACLVVSALLTLAAVKWHYRRMDALHALGRAEVAGNPLVEQVAQALQLRRTLPASERGKSPDDELLDAGAYRKLIQDGVTTEAELSALGKAIAAALKLDRGGEQTQQMSALARDAGLDMESALFYRDLAAAASEIEVELALPE